MNLKVVAGILAAGLCAAAPAFSATIDFEGVAGGYGSIADYYNGGFDIPAIGTPGSGPNLGVHFGLDLIAVDDPGQFNTSNLPSGTSAMGVGGSGGDYSMTVAAGIQQLSFFYSATSDTSVTLSFVGGASQLYTLLANTGACDVSGPAFCNWTSMSLDLGGRIATGVDFAATSGLAAFDNVSVSAVPLPAAALLLPFGLAAIGGAARRRKTAV